VVAWNAVAACCQAVLSCPAVALVHQVKVTLPLLELAVLPPLPPQVDPGEVELRVGRSSADIETSLRYTLTGQRREVGFDRVLHPGITWLATE